MLVGKTPFFWAKQIAKSFGVPVEEWMLWDAWVVMPGCNVCRTKGPNAPCWGRAECHGYANGCGCIDCEQMRSLSAQTDEDWTED